MVAVGSEWAFAQHFRPAFVSPSGECLALGFRKGLLELPIAVYQATLKHTGMK